MSFLDQVSKGTIKRNFNILLYGVEGIGKSYFGAHCPSPIFLAAEDGTDTLDVARLPSPKGWPDVPAMVTELIQQNHPYKTLVIDTLDWLEIILHKHLMESKRVNTLQELGAYGAYVDVVNREWLKLIDLLKQLRVKMNILLLAHSEVKRFSDPQQNVDYDRYELKLHMKKSASLFKEFVDCLLFANYEVATREDKAKKTRAYGDGTRVVFTERRPSHDAKNRFGMPYEIPLDYGEVSKYFNLESNDELIKEIMEINKKIANESTRAKIFEAVKGAASDRTKLMAMKERALEIVCEQ